MHYQSLFRKIHALHEQEMHHLTSNTTVAASHAQLTNMVARLCGVCHHFMCAFTGPHSGPCPMCMMGGSSICGGAAALCC
jgi:hypothetical protein